MRTVCGLDVHKDSVYLCILSSTGEIYEKKFGVLTTELIEMRDLMLSHHVLEVGMESTSVYWVPIWRVLEPHFKLKLINPYFIKQLPGHKSDVKDAQWIAECMLKELVNGSFVPPERIQQLRQYDRRIYDLDDEIIRKLAKLDAAVQRCNIRLSNYVSNTDSVSYKAVIDKICEGVTDPNVLVEEIHGRIINHHGKETIIASLTGSITECDIDIMRQLKAEIDLAEQHKQECMDKMLAICENEYSTQLHNLQTIPGVKMRAATSLIAEIGTDQGEPAIPQSATGTAGGQHHHQRGEEHPHYRSCRHCRDTRQHDARYDAGGAVHHRATQQPCGTTHPVYLLMAGRKHQP